MFAMLRGNFSSIAAVKVEPLLRIFHRLQIAIRIGMHAERQPECFAVETAVLCEQLLVDADGQGGVIAENLELFLQGIQQVAGFLCGGRGSGDGIHEGKVRILKAKAAGQKAYHGMRATHNCKSGGSPPHLYRRHL